MKDLNDLNNLKNMPMRPFSNAYDHLIKDIQNDLISKSDGIERAKSKLSDWNEAAKEVIIVAVLEKFDGMFDFVLNNAELLEEFAKL